jgi:hypothetical protein
LEKKFLLFPFTPIGMIYPYGPGKLMHIWWLVFPFLSPCGGIFLRTRVQVWILLMGDHCGHLCLQTPGLSMVNKAATAHALTNKNLGFRNFASTEIFTSEGMRRKGHSR